MTVKTSELQDKLPDELKAALVAVFGELLRDARTAWQAELDVLKAERRALIAELKAEVANFKLDLLAAKAGR